MKKKPKAPKHPTASRRTSFKASTATPTAVPTKWIRSEKPLPLPTYVKAALQKLSEAGHVAYIVGGSVRDFLLGREIKDHDIATSAKPEEICRLFPNAIEVGREFGVIKVPTGAEPPLLEIATFRQDLEYRDHRHPTGVIFAGPAEDAQRRDITVNALFYDPKSSRILDCVNGMADLQAKVIRAIGVPADRFDEDALRLLRAVRFTTRLGFTLDPVTAQAIQQEAKLISKVSAERIRDELTLMLTGPDPVAALDLLSRLGLLKQVLPELEALKGLPQSPLYQSEGDVWRSTLKTLRTLVAQNPSRSATLVWATVLHDVGKPAASRKNQGKNFNSHEIEGAEIAARIATRLKMSRAEIDRIRALVEDQLKMRDVFKMREATLVRLIREPHFEELLALHRAEAVATDGNLAFYEFCRSRLDALKALPAGEERRLLDGKDLIQLGFQPGPEFSNILRVVEDLTLEHRLKSKEEALEYVVKHFVR